MEHLVSIGNKFIFGTSGIGWNAFSNRMRKIHSFFLRMACNMKHKPLTEERNKTCSLFNKNSRRNAKKRNDQTNIFEPIWFYAWNSAICEKKKTYTHAVSMPYSFCLSQQHDEHRAPNSFVRTEQMVELCTLWHRACNCELFGALNCPWNNFATKK